MIFSGLISFSSFSTRWKSSSKSAQLLGLQVKGLLQAGFLVVLVLGRLLGLIAALLILVLQLLLLGLVLVPDLVDGLLLHLLPDVGDDEVGEVDDLLQVLDGQVQDQADLGRHAAQEPDVGGGAASSIWPIRSRRTRECVTSTPHLSQMMPL